MGYVCAFRGRRDNYQVPLALAECGKLDSFLTDHYFGHLEQGLSRLLPRHWAQSLQDRQIEELADTRITRLRLISTAEAVARLMKVSAARIYETFDPLYGHAASRHARHLESDLLMYSSYASEAFNAPYRHNPRKILFQYHPHHEIEDAILESDSKASQKLGIAFEGQLENSSGHQKGTRQRGDSAWRVSDHIICASSFTKHSLVVAGADPKRISVIPYGVVVGSPTADDASKRATHGFHALFVGSGLQRKGLHHLLWAWQRAHLPADARLTVVARVVDQGLNSLLASTPGVQLKRGVSAAELAKLYATSTVFVMPSLVEGFGQVYLEALARGLPVIGTSHTCLGDIGGQDQGIFLTQPGEIDELASLLERLSVQLEGDMAIRSRAAERARQFSWARFRLGLQELL